MYVENNNLEIPVVKFNSEQPEFLLGFYIDESICKRLIKFFKDNPNKHELGKFGNLTSKEPKIDKDFKDSIDLCLMPQESFPEWDEYRDSLIKCAKKYVKIFPRSNDVDSWNIIEKTNIQYYPPGGGFKAWHTERFTGLMPFSLRHLVFMTYLNDVTDEGETEFYHQKIKVKPKTGLTLIWPADWTYYHRGIPSPTQEKYIITGWFNFLLRK